MILLIDNYDSFTYNLKQYLLELNQRIQVARNDEITLQEISRLNPSHIVISPGPGRPENAGISVDLIKEFSGKIPILGVCLGHQAIGLAFKGNIISAKKLMHGKVSRINHDEKGIFIGVPNNFEATRYHSLAVERKSLPDCLEISAVSEEDEIMGLRHKYDLTEGVQFHPESILTHRGRSILKNFLEYKYKKKAEGILIKEAIKAVVEGKDLDEKTAVSVINEIMEGNSTEAQIASLLTSLRLKGETIEEITAFARVMREKSIKINPRSTDLVDTCGTGGDESGTFNISTTSAFITAGAGIKVAKHGNRSVSSRAGSADVLEALNIRLELTPEQVAECIDQVGIGFLFAPKLHPAMKYAIGPRREIGIRTVFNILGPLTNPASASFQVMGVYRQELVERLAHVLKNLGIKRGYVVSSDDGLDEVSISSPTLCAKITENDVTMEKFKPGDVGFSISDKKEIIGGNALDNASITKNILKGKEGACRDIACLNAGFAIASCRNLSIKEGVKIAEEAIDSGNAERKLQEMIDYTNSI